MAASFNGLTFNAFKGAILCAVCHESCKGDGLQIYLLILVQLLNKCLFPGPALHWLANKSSGNERIISCFLFLTYSITELTS